MSDETLATEHEWLSPADTEEEKDKKEMSIQAGNPTVEQHTHKCTTVDRPGKSIKCTQCGMYLQTHLCSLDNNPPSSSTDYTFTRPSVMEARDRYRQRIRESNATAAVRESNITAAANRPAACDNILMNYSERCVHVYESDKTTGIVCDARNSRMLSTVSGLGAEPPSKQVTRITGKINDMSIKSSKEKQASNLREACPTSKTLGQDVKQNKSITADYGSEEETATGLQSKTKLQSQTGPQQTTQQKEPNESTSQKEQHGMTPQTEQDGMTTQKGQHETTSQKEQNETTQQRKQHETTPQRGQHETTPQTAQDDDWTAKQMHEHKDRTTPQKSENEDRTTQQKSENKDRTTPQKSENEDGLIVELGSCSSNYSVETEKEIIEL